MQLFTSIDVSIDMLMKWQNWIQKSKNWRSELNMNSKLRIRNTRFLKRF